MNRERLTRLRNSGLSDNFEKERERKQSSGAVGPSDRKLDIFSEFFVKVTQYCWLRIAKILSFQPAT